jgi:hypothetical protein
MQKSGTARSLHTVSNLRSATKYYHQSQSQKAQFALTFKFRKVRKKKILKPKYTGLSKIKTIEGKRIAAPLEAWSGPECSRKLRFPDFMTMAHEADKFVSLTHRPPLPPGNTYTWYSFLLEAE